MESIGGQIMSMRVDEQLIGIVANQFNHALSSIASYSLKSEADALVEAFYHLLSLRSLPSAWGGEEHLDLNTPGMEATSLMSSTVLNSIYSLCGVLVAKWALLRIQLLASHEGIIVISPFTAIVTITMTHFFLI